MYKVNPTPEQREQYHVLKTYWQERINWLPSPYQFFIWLDLYRLDALKEAVRCSARWLKRHCEKNEPITYTDDLIRYFSATARYIQSNMTNAEEVDAESEDQGYEGAIQ